MRSLNLLGLVLVVAAAWGLFQLKHEVQQLESKLSALDHELIGERESVRVLQAEWSYLNRPERLATLAAEYLELAPIVSHQLGNVRDVPEAFATASDVVFTKEQ